MRSVVKVVEPITAPHPWVEDALAEAEKAQNARLSADLLAVIAEARGVWKKMRFPTPKVEGWKYTNPEEIARGPFRCGGELEGRGAARLLDSARISGLVPSSEVVFVDGVFSKELSSLSSTKGLRITRFVDESSRDANSSSSKVGELGLHTSEPFAALATALVTDGVCISVANGTVIDQPIHVVHLATSAAEGRVMTPRLLIDAGEASQVTVIESHVGAEDARYLSLPVGEIFAASGAIVDHYKIQNESAKAFHVSGLSSEQRNDSTVRTHIFSFGGSLVRNNAEVRLNGSGARGVLNGLSLLSKAQHVDNSTLIHHIEPHAESQEHFKGIYADESRGVFSGTITVEKIAQKTNAFQSNQALLLSPDASIETRPQLKIWADDVKCTHGATVGQLDANAMFYLQSRGVGREEARAFLVHAFASEVLTTVKVGAVREAVEATLSRKLEAVQG